MRIRIVGSGTLFPDGERGAPSHWIETGPSAILMDCGSGSLRTLAKLGLPWQRVSHVILTHFHTDHIADLSPLLFALKHCPEPSREEPLGLLGPQGLHAHLQALAGAHGAHVLDPGFPLEVQELSPGDSWADPAGGFHLHTMATRHTEGSLAFRVETDVGAVGFTGDTGPQTGLGDFFRGCGVLLAECSHPDGTGPDTHLTPRGLLQLASTAAPDLLVTLHTYPPMDPEAVPGLLKGGGYAGLVVAGRDGMGLSLEGGRVSLENA